MCLGNPCSSVYVPCFPPAIAPELAEPDQWRRFSRLRVVLDVDQQLPPGHSLVQVGKRIEKLFGGKYMTDCGDEFPARWFSGAKLAAGGRDPALNLFGVEASQPLSVWQAKGWIHPDDPRGWFQWYCRYFLGRRMADDARQIGRWKAMRRHVRQLERACERGDLHCRPRQRHSEPAPHRRRGGRQEPAYTSRRSLAQRVS